MVQEIHKFKSTDGSEWPDYDSAAQRDTLCLEVDFAMNLLPKVDVDGPRFFQHDKANALEAKRRLFKLACREHLSGYPKLLAADPDQVHPYSSVGRILDDCGGPIADAWARLMRINFENGREYEQPYFAMNPNEAPTEMP